MLILAGAGIAAYFATRDPVRRYGIDIAVSATPPTFATTQKLLAYLDAKGLGCGNYTPVANPIGAITRGSCYVSGTLEVAVGIYSTRADADATWTNLSGMLRGVTSINMAIGPNWTVAGPDDWTRRVASATGADYRTQPA